VDILSVRDDVCKINVINDKLSKSAVLATLKVNSASGVSRIEVKVRTSEGQVGNLEVFVIPTGKNTAMMLEVELKPLNLH
jgi:hypothetical protein